MAGSLFQRCSGDVELGSGGSTAVELHFSVLGGEAAADGLNRFLAGHRILAVDRYLAQDGGAAVWTICVSYESAGDSRPPSAKRGKVDYREVLNVEKYGAPFLKTDAGLGGPKSISAPTSRASTTPSSRSYSPASSRTPASLL